jgi:glutamate carboxypeptidase
MKGGLIVALHALEALAACGHRVAWTFMLNSDEETGSYHSDAAMRAEAAKGYAAGLVFEPAMANGGLVTQRPGSGQFMIETRGKSGHVGRDFASCVSAVTPLARCILAASAMARPEQGAIVNIGPIRGGIATNVVPDSAAAWGNVRFETPEIAAELGASLDALATSPDAMPSIAVHRSFQRPAKPCTPAVERLALAARAAAESLGQSLPFGKTGGVCDGNNLQAAGLPVIDTLGVRGGGLHTTDEWVEARSLVERAQLVAVLLSRLARGGVDAA